MMIPECRALNISVSEGCLKIHQAQNSSYTPVVISIPIEFARVVIQKLEQELNSATAADEEPTL